MDGVTGTLRSFLFSVSPCLRGSLIVSLFLLAFIPAGFAAAPDKVVATVERQLITESDLDGYLFELRLEDGSLWAWPDDALRVRILPSVIEEHLLYRRGFNLASEPDDAEVRALAREARAELESLAGSPLQLRRLAREMGRSETWLDRWLEERARRTLVVNTLVVSRMDPAVLNLPADTAADATRVHLAHLLFLPARRGSEESWTEAHERALRAWVHLGEGLTFARAASLFSDDSATAEAAGDLGWFEPDALQPPIRAAIAPLAVGEISRPVRTDSGWHLFQLVDLDSERRAAFAAEANRARAALLTELLPEADVAVSPAYTPPRDAPPRPLAPDRPSLRPAVPGSDGQPAPSAAPIP